MEFFKTDDGALHTGRLGGVLLGVGTLISCSTSVEPTCVMWVLLALGWMLAFCGKHAFRSFTEPMARVRTGIGVNMMAIAVLRQLYAMWRGH
jgi:hypothetical protein